MNEQVSSIKCPSTMRAVNGSDGRERFARENHSEIERRRRNKMTHYISELADMVPQCAALGRKPDKLTILRMAVSHMKSIRGNVASFNGPPGTVSCQPSFLTDHELKHLVLEAANGFLFVLNCDTARVIYVADSILPVLNVSQEEWMNNSFYDLIHPEDMSKIRDQLTITDGNHSRVLDLKTGTVKKDQGSGKVHLNCRRGFICRLRIGNINCMPRMRNRYPVFDYAGQNYTIVHCTGYVKSNPPIGVQYGQAIGGACLVAIARLQFPSMFSSQIGIGQTPQLTFRVTKDGLITFVDRKAQEFLNKPSLEILGKNVCSFAHPMEEQLVKETIKKSIQSQQHQIVSCKWSRKSHQNPELVEHLPVSFDAYAFTNPHSSELEYVIVTLTLEGENASLEHNQSSYYHQPNEEYASNLAGLGVQQQSAAHFITPINQPIEASEQQYQNNAIPTHMNWPMALAMTVTGNELSDSTNYPNVMANAPPSNGYLPNANTLLPHLPTEGRWPSLTANVENGLDLLNANLAANVLWPEQQHNFMQ